MALRGAVPSVRSLQDVSLLSKRPSIVSPPNSGLALGEGGGAGGGKAAIKKSNGGMGISVIGLFGPAPSSYLLARYAT